MKIYGVFVIASIFVASICAKSKISVRIEKVACTVHDPSSVTVHLCSLKAINRTTTLINFGTTYIKPMHAFLVNSQLLKKSEIRYSPFLVNVTDDYCAFAAKRKAGGVYFRIVWPIIEPYTNMGHHCPVQGYRYVKDLPVDASKLPPAWPNGQFLLNVLIMGSNNNKIFTMSTYFELKQLQIF